MSENLKMILFAKIEKDEYDEEYAESAILAIAEDSQIVHEWDAKVDNIHYKNFKERWIDSCPISFFFSWTGEKHGYFKRFSPLLPTSIAMYCSFLKIIAESDGENVTCYDSKIMNTLLEYYCKDPSLFKIFNSGLKCRDQKIE